MKKVLFPPAVLVPSIVLESFIGMAAGLLMFLIYKLFVADAGLGLMLKAIFLVPLAFFLALFTTWLGWILSVLNVYWRDLPHLVNIFLTLWFYATPIIYPPEIVPEKWGKILLFNPVHLFISLFRDFMLEQKVGSVFLWVAVSGRFFKG